MKKLIFLIFAFAICFFVGVSYARAVDNADSQIAKYQITFPIADLGNCNSYAQCKAYCNDVVHRDECISFAKKKGFYKEQKVNQEVIAAAKSELGCDSEDSCKAICEDPANKDKCEAFAKAHNLAGHKSGDSTVLEKAKNILGCDSEASCKAFCQSEENKQKCSEFAKSAGIGGGERKVGPGGCTSETACKAYCQSHLEECKQIMRQHQQQGWQNSQDENRSKTPLPGGCSTVECAKNFCSEHKSECSMGQRGELNTNNKPNMEEICRQNPERCKQKEDNAKNFLKDIRQTFQGNVQNEAPSTPPNVQGVSTFSFLGSIRSWLGI